MRIWSVTPLICWINSAEVPVLTAKSVVENRDRFCHILFHEINEGDLMLGIIKIYENDYHLKIGMLDTRRVFKSFCLIKNRNFYYFITLIFDLIS